MKILHVMPAVAPRYGGPSAAIRGMAPAQVARGHEVHVATTDADGPARLDVPVSAPVVDDGVTYHYFPRTIPGEYKFSWPMTRWLWEHAGEFDVVHVHYLFSYSTIPGCRASRRSGVPFVVRPLGTLDPWSFGHRKWKKVPYYRAIELAHLRAAAAIHATSSSEADAIAARGFGARTHVVELGVHVPPPIARAEPAIGGPARLAFVSRLHPVKGIPLLLDAMAEAVRRGAQLELDIAGTGEAAYEARLREAVRENGLADRVRFHGHVDGAEKAALLARADAFVLPSSRESFGIAVAEAMAAGLPALVSDQVAIAPQIDGAGGGLVFPLQRERLVETLLASARDCRALRAMGARARALTVERFSWGRTAAGLDAVYAAARERVARRTA